MKAISRQVHIGLAVGVLLLSFLLTISYREQSAQSKKLSSRRDRLVSLVLNRQAHAAGIEKELSSLRQRVDSLEKTSPGPLAALEQEIDRLAFLSGALPLTGSGITVTLKDSPQAATENSPDFLVQDVDLQLAVNALWAAGAEAISVNGQRIVSSSAIRSAGKAILVNYKVISNPYRFLAIGDPGVLRAQFQASEIARRFRKWHQIYQLSMAISSESNLKLPAFLATSHRSYVNN